VESGEAGTERYLSPVKNKSSAWAETSDAENVFVRPDPAGEEMDDRLPATDARSFKAVLYMTNPAKARKRGQQFA
jgi:hypothetical protein